MSTSSHKWLLIAVGLLLTACADESTSPVLPQTKTQQSWFDDEDFGRPPDLRFVATFKTKPAPPDPLHDHAMIGPAGGSLRVGDFEIVVPPGAVERPTNFRIKIPVDPQEQMRAFAEFGPHIIFRRPVTLRLPGASTTVTGEPYAMWWTGFFWLPLPTISNPDGRIETRVWHFSTYGTSSSAKGPILLGG